MQILSPIAAAVIAAAVVGTAAAQDADAPAAPTMPHSLDCSVTAVTVCTDGGECSASETFGELALPTRMLIDAEKRVVATVNADGLPHLSAIRAFAEAGDHLVFQGIDGPTGWMIQGSKADDTMTFTVASHHTVLNAFGTCRIME